MPGERTQERGGVDEAPETAVSRRAGDAEPSLSRAGGAEPAVPRSREIGGPKGPEPTRFGDWERAGRCDDF